MSQLKWMRIKFEELQILHSNPTVEAYYSITFNEKMYFSSVFDDQSTLQMKNDIIIPLDGKNVENISLQRWQSHVIVFDHDISLSQLKSKSIIKKKFQARKNQIITFTVTICGQKDILFCETLIRKVTQHYLLLQNIKLKNQNAQKRGDYGACYFKINTSKNQFDIPVQNGNCLIYLPQTFQISQYRNSKFYSKSKEFTFEQLSKGIEQIQLLTDSNSYAGKVIFEAHWIVDVSAPLPVQYLLLHSIEIIIYDFQLKFDIPTDFVGSKMKISCNNKLFQFNDQLGNSKMIRIKKAAWIVCKSPHDHIQIKIERNHQIISRIDLLAEDLVDCQLTKCKQKLVDASNSSKTLGLIKYNVQKTKGYPNPQNQTYWKESIKKKSTGSILIEQLSVCYEQDEPISILIKTENEQKRVEKISNINFFQQEPLIYHNPVILSPKPDQTLYFMVRGQLSSQNAQDFLGIAVLNVNDLKLGKNPYEIDFYKNQQKIGSINCIMNKYAPIAFVKSIFQPQVLPLAKILDLKLSINTMTLSPYFFSYKYDNQSQVFCIVEVNKVKKVLILEPTFQQLSFVPASSSDNLSFTVDVDQIVKVKVTIMIGDGMNEIIYGTNSTSIKMEQLREKQEISKKQVKFTNYAQTNVGKCNLIIQIQKQSTKKLERSKSKQKLPFQGRNRSSNSKKQKNTKDTKDKSISILQFTSSERQQQNEIKTIKNLLPTRKHIQRDSNHQSFNLDKKGTAQSKIIPKLQTKQSVRLPMIKEKNKKDSFNDLFISMNVRKRTIGGYDYSKPIDEDNQTRDNQLSSRLVSKQKSIDYQSLRNNNPNMERNFEILFPPKKGQTKQQQIKSQLNKYEQKLRGLKSVLNEISNDIGPIEPSVKEGNNTENLSRDQTNNFEYAGNEFL